MATKPQRLLLFLLLLAFQEMMTMLGEAALCETPSKLFNGVCFSDKNCGAICEKEGFLNGRCKLLKCICSKDCGIGGGGGGEGGGPGQGPPGEGPPEEGPPSGGEGPPTDGGPPDEGTPGIGEPPNEGPSKRKRTPILDMKS